MKCPLGNHSEQLKHMSFNVISFQDCIKENCAWWNEKECGILSIAKNSEIPEIHMDSNCNCKK